MIQIHVPYWIYRRLHKEEKQIDAVTLLVGLVGPIATIPQIYQIFSTHDAHSLSLFSWLFYALATLISTTYSIAHKLKPLFWGNVCWLIVYVFMIYGILTYR